MTANLPHPSSKDRTWLDWDSIREAEGFKVGDQVRCRGAAIGVIRNLILASPGRMRARVHWPTIPYASEEYVSPNGCEQFIDLADLSRVEHAPEPVQQPIQLELV